MYKYISAPMLAMQDLLLRSQSQGHQALLLISGGSFALDIRDDFSIGSNKQVEVQRYQ